ncbi:MAG: hypothetical protein KDK11_01150 [Maritimibacter sp.]|nr:hypothetical protein [Maritimibacter sp.]
MNANENAMYRADCFTALIPGIRVFPSLRSRHLYLARKPGAFATFRQLDGFIAVAGSAVKNGRSWPASTRISISKAWTGQNARAERAGV